MCRKHLLSCVVSELLNYHYEKLYIRKFLILCTFKKNMYKKNTATTKPNIMILYHDNITFV